MPAHKVNLLILQGETFEPIFHWKTGSDPATATAVDLTDCEARAHFRASVEAEDFLLELTDANGRIVLGTTDGSIQLLLSATETAAIEWREAVYDLEIEFPSGRVVRRMEGKVKVSPEVTR